MKRSHGLMLIIIWSIVLAIVVSLFVFFAVGRQLDVYKRQGLFVQ